MASAPAPLIIEAVEPEPTVEPVVTETRPQKTAEPVVKVVDTPDWRSALAGEDKELLGLLGRYHSQDAALKAFKKNNDDIKKGLLRKPLGDDPTEDELASYRVDYGIPDKPEGYLEKLPDGLVVGDDDRPFVDQFAAKMHEVNAPKAAVDAALGVYYEIVDAQEASASEAAAQAMRAGEDALRTEWGPDYRRNLTAMHNHLDGLPEPVRELFTHGRMGDGSPIGYNPEILKWLVGSALEANPAATVVHGTGSNQAAALADEIAGHEKRMASDRKAWFRDEAAQARLRELYEVRDKLAAR